jgi:hypothetical protein
MSMDKQDSLKHHVTYLPWNNKQILDPINWRALSLDELKFNLKPLWNRQKNGGIIKERNPKGKFPMKTFRT